jgi:CBS domain-containing protein
MRYMSVESAMTKDVVTVKASDKIACVWLLLMDKDVSGAPVVDDQGVFVGVLSVTDINRAIMDRARKAGAVHDASCEASTDPEVQRQRLRSLAEAMRAVSDSPVSGIIPTTQVPHVLGPFDSLTGRSLMAEFSVNAACRERWACRRSSRDRTSSGCSRDAPGRARVRKPRWLCPFGTSYL